MLSQKQKATLVSDNYRDATLLRPQVMKEALLFLKILLLTCLVMARTIMLGAMVACLIVKVPVSGVLLIAAAIWRMNRREAGYEKPKRKRG